jgi:hypothetical protein
VHPDGDLVVILIALVSTAIGMPLAVGISRWLGSRTRATPPPAVAPGVEERLQRIENAVDAIAVEMERVSEGQRFTTKLLAERAGADRAPDAASPNR